MKTLEEVKELNYDHHARMKADFNARGGVTNDTIRKLDDDSYVSLLKYVPKGERLLELGSASGGQWKVLSHWADKLTGVDLYEPYVKASEEAGLDIHLGFVEQLPFEDSIFDIVCSRHVMEHLGDVDKGLEEIKRVLKPGGYVANVTPHYFPDPEPSHINQYKSHEWTDLYIKHGFEIVGVGVSHFNCEEFHIVARKHEPEQTTIG
jgi:ubiquinone/menaquinone biosynthesis C-methylase UbiE